MTLPPPHTPLKDKIHQTSKTLWSWKFECFCQFKAWHLKWPNFINRSKKIFILWKGHYKDNQLSVLVTVVICPHLYYCTELYVTTDLTCCNIHLMLLVVLSFCLSTKALKLHAYKNFCFQSLKHQSKEPFTDNSAYLQDMICNKNITETN